MGLGYIGIWDERRWGGGYRVGGRDWGWFIKGMEWGRSENGTGRRRGFEGWVRSGIFGSIQDWSNRKKQCDRHKEGTVGDMLLRYWAP